MEKKFVLALSAHPQIGARTLFKLSKELPNFEVLWKNPKALAKTRLTDTQKQAVSAAVAQFDPEKEQKKLDKLGIGSLLFTDPNYPKPLKELPDPPFLLYIRGQILPQDDIALAVVGSRRFTEYGARATEDLTYNLAQDLTIVSGLALGIDTIAHKAALAAKGRTIGVLACGLDQVYPTANTHLADKILASGGAILSEFPPGFPAYRPNFPIRNRIIAGLSLGTLVIEAAPDSGSLITAQAALEYNREVFSVPGPIYSETSLGTNRLIQMGAKLVINHKDILDELNIIKKQQENESQQVIADSPEEEILLNLLKEPKLIDELVKATKMGPSLVNSTLIMLEMKGVIKNLGGTRFVIKGTLRE